MITEQPIRQGLRSAVDIYLYAMRPFMIRCLRQFKGRRVEDIIRHSLNGSQVNWFDRDLKKGKSVKDSIDVGHFGLLMYRNWNEIFHSAFNGDESVRNRVANIKHFRNRLAHPSQQDIEQDIDPKDAKKCLAEIVDMLGRINRPEEKRWVEAISQQLFSPTVSADVSVQEQSGPEQEAPEDAAPPSAEETVAYWVYEDRPTNRARIHRATCRFCNDGTGLHGSRLPDNRWIGPLESSERALEVALDTERKDIAECKFCRPLQ